MTLSRDALTAHLQTRRYGRDIELLASTASTNDDAKERAYEVAPGHLIVADTQTHGRGAHGHSWASPSGTDLYFSIIDRVNVEAHALPALTLAVGLGLAEGVDALTQKRALVKWPNDIWLDEKKCAGILVESTSTGSTLGPVVIGVGLNVNRSSWDEELAPIATSLSLACNGRIFDRNEVLARVLFSIETRVDEFAARGALPIVRVLEARLALHHERVSIEGYGEGILDGLMDDGALRLHTESGMRVAVAGSLRRAR